MPIIKVFHFSTGIPYFYIVQSFSHEMKNTFAETSDLELLENIQAGNEDAFEILFRRYYSVLYRFTGRIVKDPQEAENIVQDLFVRFWEKRSDITITSSLKSYLYTSAKNHALNYIKRENRLTSIDEHFDISKENMDSPDSRFERNETADAVHRAINKLPEKCRQIYLMKKYDDLSYNEISEVLGISVNTVKTQIKRAFKSLSENLDYLKASILVLIAEIMR